LQAALLAYILGQGVVLQDLERGKALLDHAKELETLVERGAVGGRGAAEAAGGLNTCCRRLSGTGKGRFVDGPAVGGHVFQVKIWGIFFGNSNRWHSILFKSFSIVTAIKVLVNEMPTAHRTPFGWHPLTTPLGEVLPFLEEILSFEGKSKRE